MALVNRYVFCFKTLLGDVGTVGRTVALADSSSILLAGAMVCRETLSIGGLLSVAIDWPVVVVVW